MNMLLKYPTRGRPQQFRDTFAEWERMLSGKQARPSQDMVYKQVGIGSQILQDVGVRKMKLMSAPLRFSAISGFDLEVVEHIACT